MQFRLTRARAAAVLALVLATSACSGTESASTPTSAAPDSTPSIVTDPGTMAPTLAPTPTATPTDTVTALPSLADEFAAWAKKRGIRVGMAVTAPGQPVIVAGPLKTGTAWSTSKVPVSLAALRADDSASTKSLVRSAITRSDNSAAAVLFYRPHGSRAAGAKAVNRTFRRYGDPTTKVASSPGLTTWALKDQVVFTSTMACEPDAAVVRSYMGQVIDEHRWGLGRIDDARLKGGWGPDSRGLYTVRQMGLIGNKTDGWTAITIISRPKNGVFETGISELNAITKWLANRRDRLPVAACV